MTGYQMALMLGVFTGLTLNELWFIVTGKPFIHWIVEKKNDSN